MTVREAADACGVLPTKIHSWIRRGLVPAHKVEDRRNAAGLWIIDAPLAFLLDLLKRETGPRVVFQRVRFSLSEADCWAQVGYSFMAEAQRQGAQSYTVVDGALLCPDCGTTDLHWNGRSYYCNACNGIDPILPVPVSERKYTGTGWPFPTNVNPVQPRTDPYYARETRYVRVPAASNWPRGRNDPAVDVTREGVPDTRTYGWRRRRR